MFSTRRPPWLAAGYGLGHLFMVLPLAFFLVFVSLSACLAVLGIGVLLVRLWAPPFFIPRQTVAAGRGSCYERALPVGDSPSGLRASASNPWEGRAT